MRLGERFPTDDHRPQGAVKPSDIPVDQGLHAALQSHGLQRLDAVQRLQQPRHEGLLKPGLVLPSAATDGNEPARHDHAACADDERGHQNFPGYGDGQPEIDQKLNTPGQNVAGSHISVGGACRLAGDGARQIAGPLICEMRQARPQKRANDREPQIHRSMGRRVSDLRHGRQHQQRFQGDRPDDQHQQPAEGKFQPEQGKDPLEVERRCASAIDHQAEERQQCRDAYPLRQGGRRERQQRQRAAPRIGRKEVFEQSDGLSHNLVPRTEFTKIAPAYEPLAKFRI